MNGEKAPTAARTKRPNLAGGDERLAASLGKLEGSPAGGGGTARVLVRVATERPETGEGYGHSGRGHVVRACGAREPVHGRHAPAHALNEVTSS